MNVFQWFARKTNSGQVICNQKLWVDCLTLPKKPTMDISLDRWFSTRGAFVPQATFGEMTGTSEGRMLLVSRE